MKVFGKGVCMYGVCVMEECGEFVYHAYVLQGGGSGDETVETGMMSHPMQVPPLWYISLNGGNRTEAFNLALARVTMHQPNMGHTHVR